MTPIGPSGVETKIEILITVQNSSLKAVDWFRVDFVASPSYRASSFDVAATGEHLQTSSISRGRVGGWKRSDFAEVGGRRLTSASLAQRSVAQQSLNRK